MAKRGRKKKFRLSFNISPETTRSVIAISLVLAAGLSLIAFIFPSYSVNGKILEILKEMLGHPSILLPFVLGFAGLLFIDSLKNRFKEGRLVLGLSIALLSFSSLFSGFKEDAGGKIGNKVFEILSGAISSYGAMFVFFCLLVLAGIIIFDVSLGQILGFVLRRGKKERKEAKEGDDSTDQDVVISTGIHPTPIEEEIAEVQDSTGVEVAESKFEVVPTMAEPQKNVVMNGDVEVSSITGPSSGLPYADKVWELPPYDLLHDGSSAPPDTGDVQKNARIIKETLKSFSIDVEVVDIQVGPSVTKYALGTPAGIKVAKISNLQYDLALALASPTGSVRIEAPIPGKALVGIEVPNKTRSIVRFKPLITSDIMKEQKSKLSIILGKDVGGLTHVYDIRNMPHLLIAGTTGSGKSIFIHGLISTILFRASPQEVKFILVDPKRVELAPYQDIPHLYTPLVTDIDKAPAVFKWAVAEMTRRYKLFESARARNIDSYNEKSGFQALPYILIVVDELAEIMVADPASVEKSIIRLAQLARATGIHLILAAQRPSTNVITGLIKANIPCRIAFNVTGQVDSRVIIDQAGAEKLLGKGDMLYVPPDKPTPTRLQGAWIDEKEISNLVGYLKRQGGSPDYKEEIAEMVEESRVASVSGGSGSKDAYYDEAIEVVTSAGKASASLLQRRLAIGYARAARIIDELEASGVVGPAQGSRARDVLVSSNPDIGDLDFEEKLPPPNSPTPESLNDV
ncbi:DNA translocase FtsK [Patescibacteria group bacterium]